MSFENASRFDVHVGFLKTQLPQSGCGPGHLRRHTPPRKLLPRRREQHPQPVRQAHAPLRLLRDIRNDGVTSHFNTTSSILNGQWQRVDAWGNLRPTSPTIFEYLRKDAGLAPRDTWLVSSNKALTQLIGASSAPGYGPAFGANVIFPKQLLINAVEAAIKGGRKQSLSDRTRAQDEIGNILQGINYEGLGWSLRRHLGARPAGPLHYSERGSFPHALERSHHRR